jgi:hypothetical protein
MDEIQYTKEFLQAQINHAKEILTEKDKYQEKALEIQAKSMKDV